MVRQAAFSFVDRDILVRDLYSVGEREATTWNTAETHTITLLLRSKSPTI